MTDELPTRLSGRARAAKFKRLPLTPADLDAAETRLRRPLPPLLRQIYSELGPGFGPGDTGLLPPPPALLPGGLFPLCDWGSGIQSAFDALSPDARIVRVDPNMPKGDVPARVPPALHFDRAAEADAACWVESPSLAEWLSDWLDGVPLFYAAYRGAEEDDADEDEEDGEE